MLCQVSEECTRDVDEQKQDRKGETEERVDMLVTTCSGYRVVVRVAE